MDREQQQVEQEWVEQCDRILGTAIVLLESRDEHEAAALLEMSTLVHAWGWNNEDLYELQVDPTMFDAVRNTQAPINAALCNVLDDQEPPSIKPRLIGQGWREARHEERALGVSNQGSWKSGENGLTVKGLKFADPAEVRVAEALSAIQREQRATDSLSWTTNVPVVTKQRQHWVDFVVTFRERTGVLEVDGDTHRKGSRYMADASRDAQLRDAGVKLVQRIAAEDTNNATELRAILLLFLERVSDGRPAL